MPTTHVIIHGHFYQPPRENPWTGEIEAQESAAPYHDWNERITEECYRPNARSRVLDGQGRVLDVVNNFEHFSFNFGPTLMSYLENHHPATYRRILEGDRACLARTGSGNAMAQAYNHMIMPLASARDRRTQILWGVADFRARFHREPAGMWLPETAVNPATLEDLAGAGLKFVLLAPGQAEAIRAPGEKNWRSVANGTIPTDRPYRCVTGAGEIALFFYHEGISRAVAFEHLLRNAGLFADRIQEAAGRSAQGDRLVLVCSDGEAYGHHSPMGDMCFAYLASRELPARGMQLTTPEAYLAKHPPAWEVRIKGGEGTAWSCAHGVGRWTRDCGCSTGGPASWNQGWREPLRRGLDRLRERLDTIFEREGAKHLRDPWKARDDYIQVLLGKPLGAARGFFDRHAVGELGDEERGRVYRLMEMQHHGMLMYTSCGWFFSDLSGIETVQNLKYACRAALLGERLAGEPVDAGLLEELALAKSNLPEIGTGTDIFTHEVLPAVLSAEKVAAHQAMMAVVEPLGTTERLYSFRVTVHQQESDERSGFEACCSRLTVQTDRTREGGSFDAAAILGTNLRLMAFVRPFDPSNERITPSDLLAAVERDGFEEACRRFAGTFPHGFALSDMLADLRNQAVGVLLRPLIAEVEETCEDLFTANEGVLRALQPLGIPLPEGLRNLVGHAGGLRFNRLAQRHLDEKGFGKALELSKMLEALNVPLNRRPMSRLVTARLAELLEEMLAEPGAVTIGRFVELLRNGRAARLTVDEARLQDRMAEVLEQEIGKLLAPDRIGGAAGDTARALVEVAGLLNLNVEGVWKLLEEKTGRGHGRKGGA